MEWWEQAELDDIFWRGERPKWENLMWRNPSRERIEQLFLAHYPFEGVFDFSVKERAVWRLLSAAKKKNYLRRKAMRVSNRLKKRQLYFDFGLDIELERVGCERI